MELVYQSPECVSVQNDWGETIAVFKKGDEIFTILRHVSRSGMMRIIEAVKFENGQPLYLHNIIKELLDYKIDYDRGGVKVSGCGMDIGFGLVYNLSRRLFQEKNPDKDTGYWLKQRWL